MTLHYTMPNAREGVPELIKRLKLGQPYKVDGRMTYEARGAIVTIEDPIDSLPVDIGIRLDISSIVREYLDLINGSSLVGQRIRYQLDEIEKLIITRPDTRDALVVVPDPQYDRTMPERSATVQPLIGYHFIYRKPAIDLHVYLRESDVMAHFIGQLFVAGQLLATMVNAINAPEIGSVTFHIGSLYLLSADTSITDYIKEPKVPEKRDASLPTGIEGANWEEVVQRAQWLTELIDNGVTDDDRKRFTSSERWFVDTVSPA